MSKHPKVQEAIDSRLEKVIEAANYRITLNNQKQNARLRLEQTLIYSINGGIFKASPELIAFSQALYNMGHERAIMVDINGNPIMIEDMAAFLEDLVSLYNEKMNQYMVDYKKIQQSRTTKSLLGE